MQKIPKKIYTSRYNDIQRIVLGDKIIVLTFHAIKQARKRFIDAQMVKTAILGGKIKRFGKKYIRFKKYYKNIGVQCIGEIINGTVIIKTITWC